MGFGDKFGAGFGGRFGASLGGGADTLLLWGDGAFTNASERYIWDASGKVLYGAFAGGVPAVASIGGKRRLQMEGARTNRLNAVSAWTEVGACTQTIGQTDPAGGSGAYLIEHLGTASADEIFSGLDSQTADQLIGVGMFVKRRDSSSVWVLSSRDAGRGVWQVDSSLLSDGWERITADHPAVTVTDPFQNSATGRGSFRVNDAGADTAVDIWYPQMPDEPFLSSPIAEATTRAADSMSYTAGQVPEAFRSGAWSTELTTMHASTDLATSEVMYLYYLDANNYLSLTEDGAGNVQAKWVTTIGTVVKTVTYSRDQTPTVGVNFTTGELTTADFTTGDGVTSGTVSDWPASTLYVGSDSTPANHIFGRMSEPEPG